MTDKQIIIDGADVNKCKYFDCDYKECKAEYCVRHGYEIVKYDSCRENPNCYYKQLKRKEQELQEAMDNYVQLDLQRVKEYNELVELYKAKEQECEELKKDLHKNFEEKDKLNLIIDRLLEASGYDANTASAEDFEDVYENMRYEKQQLEQFGQTLTEIKEIAENVIKNVSDRCIETTPMYCIHKQILQKTNEVLKDE